ncbi:hypothetical protein BDR03DRAFT_1009798 [Suillus americanus]|nr:hypothetical protein BDR03DRAFT_1009798 [Suillus americanus]
MHTTHQHLLLLHQKPETGTPPHHAVVLVREVLEPAALVTVVLLQNAGLQLLKSQHMHQFAYGAKKAPNPSQVLGVFGLSIRTQERDLDEEFSRFGRVEKVTIVYDQRSDRSRGFGFIRMSSTEEATRCIQELNGVELNGRRIRVDYSVTDRPHAPTPGEYMGHRRSTRDTYSGSGRDSYHRDSYRDSYRDRDHRRSDRDKDRDPYGRDSRDWRDRRSPRRYSPDYRRRGSYSRSPPRGSSPRKDFDGPSGTGAASSSNQAENGSRW